MEFISAGTEYGDGQSNLTPGYYFRMNYPKQYKCDQTIITKFEKDYKRYVEYRFYGLYPLSLDSTTVSYEGSNILKATATFQYDRYVSGQSSSLANFLNTTGNRDQPPSGTGLGSQSEEALKKVRESRSNVDTNFLSDSSTPKFKAQYNSEKLFDIGSSILNDNIYTTSPIYNERRTL
tara:strand:- start:33 stop:566 length:534 start_codon:yes stop_codon:yes gene_type:complete